MKVLYGEDDAVDVLIGRLFNDQLIGLGGNDVLIGGNGDDILEGGDGFDILIGGIGDDLMLGGNFRDIFELTMGDDTAFGGGGSDHFAVAGGFAGDHVTITDTAGLNDTLDFHGGITGAQIDMNPGGISHVDDRTIELTGLSDGGDGARALDMVLLEDLSGSFGDDVSTVRGLADDLIAAITGLTSSVRLGLASFIDKPTSPFGSSSDHEYQTELGLTNDYDAWKAALDGLTLGSGADGPESQLTGLMQVALRTAELGWSSDALKVVVLATDAVPHMAGDHDVGANDGDAVLDGPGNDGTGEDYPTLNQVKDALLAAGIVPIFAVSDFGTTVKDAYQDIVDEFGFGTVVDLSSDSSDIIEAIEGGIAEATDTLIENAIGTDQDDEIMGNNANNRILGRDGDDFINGTIGHDELLGGFGQDILIGARGFDTLDGGIGFDTLFGGLGKDTLDGGLGRDTLFGGGHADVFQFQMPDANLSDFVNDFEDGVDTINVLDTVVRDFSDIGVTADGTDVVIDVAGTDIAILRNTDVGDIDATDFTFGLL